MRGILRSRPVLFFLVLLFGTPAIRSWAAAAKPGFDLRLCDHEYELLLVTAARIFTGKPRAAAPVRNGRIVA
jgi:hypothetical protein